AMMDDDKMADDAMMDDDKMADDAMMDDDKMADDAMTDADKMADDAMMHDGKDHEIVEYTVRIENISKAYDFLASGVGGDGPIGPDGKFTFEFDAAPGNALSFASMMVPSNDFFFAPGEAGVALFDDSGNPVTGDVTSQISLWDAGTEANQKPGAGSEQPLIGGPEPSTPDADTNVRLADDAFGNLPAVNEVVKVSLESLSATRFRATIANVSTASTIAISDGSTSAVPLTPPLWVVHTAPAPLFSVGSPDRGEGLEVLAETGNPAILADSISARVGVTSPLAPGAYVVHSSADPIFTAGQTDRGEGLEGLAENGGGDALAMAISGNEGISAAVGFAATANTGQPGPLFPGDAYEFTFKAISGERLSFATMFVQSNDLFFSSDSTGIALWNDDGSAVSGDITSQIMLWDAGTEVNEAPGVGPNQAPRQSAIGEGVQESSAIELVSDGYSYPDTDKVIKVTITPTK
ncbi:MAG: hypothetical protein HQ478_09410, partial [Chloroflexi bacterium]|nr:hypothetical protein [Chloroflexota bacterium]